MFTEDELEYYEENWNIHKQGRDAIADRRGWKLHYDIWDDDYKHGHGHCWKRHRKTKHQYRIKNEPKEKKRKNPKKEHWRLKRNLDLIWNFKFSHFSCYNRGDFLRYKAKQEAKKRIGYRQAEEFINSLHSGMLIKINSYTYKVQHHYYDEYGERSLALKYYASYNILGGHEEKFITASYVYKFHNRIRIVNEEDAKSMDERWIDC